MNKKEFEDLVQDYCFELYRNMNEAEVRSFILNILYQEKVLMWPDALVQEVKNKFPGLINDGQST